MKVKGLSNECRVQVTNGRIEATRQLLGTMKDRFNQPKDPAQPDGAKITIEDLQNEALSSVEHLLLCVFNKDAEITEAELADLQKKELL